MQWITNPSGAIFDKWKVFITEHERYNFFQSDEFVRLYKLNGYNVNTYIALENNEIVASYNVLFLKENFGIFSSLTKRAVTWGLPLTTSTFFLKETLKKVIEICKNDFIFFEIRPLIQLCEQEKFAFNELNFKIDQHYTIFNDLKTNFFELYHSGRKKNIRRAQKNKLLSFRELESKEELTTAGELITSLYKNLRLPCPNIFFFNSISNYSSVKTFGVFYKEKMVACRIVLTYGTSIYDWYAAASNEGKTTFANDFIVNEIFNWGQQKGFTHFDFGGAGKLNQNYGVRDYKLKFGGNLIEIGRVFYINKPVLHLMGKLGFKILKLLRGK